MGLFLKWIYFSTIISVFSISPDPLGYILYCPCMGRFGNQVDQFLGSLDFAHALNRTLVLPPWVEYRFGEPKSVQVPFKTYFKVEELNKYHKVIAMEDFMENVAEVEWPKHKRVSFCYVSRGENNCNAKEGNPFGPFWDTFNVDFVDSEFYSPLHYDTSNPNMMKEWQFRYPANKWPVLAFTGAPASFPVQEHNRHLQNYLKWSTVIEEAADEFIAKKMPNGAFVGIHLRNGIDWVRACSHIKQSPYLFAAAQCLGYHKGSNSNAAVATEDMCLPSKESIVRQLKRTVRKYNQRGKEYVINAVFVASDGNHLLDELSDALQKMSIEVLRYTQDDTRVDKPHIDLAVLGRSNHFIGNCISSFSAFVKRERDSNGFPSTFWAFPTERNNLRNEL